MTTLDNGTNSTPAPTLPAKPAVSMFAIGTAIGAILLTIITAISVGFSLGEIISNFGRKNSVVEGLLNPDWGQIWSRRSRSAFIETLQLAVLGTATGATVALPLALWSTTFGTRIACYARWCAASITSSAPFPTCCGHCSSSRR